MGPETLPKVVGVGFGDAAVLRGGARRDLGQLAFGLGEDGSVSLSQGLVLGGGERSGLEAAIRVTGDSAEAESEAIRQHEIALERARYEAKRAWQQYN